MVATAQPAFAANICGANPTACIGKTVVSEYKKPAEADTKAENELYTWLGAALLVVRARPSSSGTGLIRDSSRGSARSWRPDSPARQSSLIARMALRGCVHARARALLLLVVSTRCRAPNETRL